MEEKVVDGLFWMKVGNLREFRPHLYSPDRDKPRGTLENEGHAVSMKTKPETRRSNASSTSYLGRGYGVVDTRSCR